MTDTLMRREVREIPAAVDRLLAEGAGPMRKAGATLRDLDPRVFVTVARGSSDHAATCFKYCAELMCGVPVASVGPSVASVYGRRLRLDGAACLAISQSGQSPDIVAMARMADEQGAATFAVTNHPDSPLADACGHILALHAGEERSVAATKTFVASVVSAIWLLAEWRQDAALLSALRALPETLETALAQDWCALTEGLEGHGSLYCIGRGAAYAMAGEAALKFKETCQLHAESYSSAEVLHGPVSIVAPGFPVLALTARDEAEAGLVETADGMAEKGARVFVTSDRASRATCLPVTRTGHPLLDPLALIVPFYASVERIAVARGIDPDTPRHLRKVTETV
ncbi:SIS domain-containing protein [Jannaschia seohaensis]|uniref:Glucosamine--fructose-6-phosphate aminotransferase (Isomerizing) n=1 Tax=Jannaschia seohaensis TaxID=475081 RepID=A0A2Y9BWC1_9RHOB|nr:SIS domain-containing protein [Jannaschia seohaensis]PWJ22534.1 glucosamine--fructose-6-phosphate aminotransferase (isomerizing) [Jannaschia seohaensis]SSA38812.1 glucosamine--fructose-6-phosphate aminotransferase (isomerizing) [Jannaschia seohaensis]